MRDSLSRRQFLGGIGAAAGAAWSLPMPRRQDPATSIPYVDGLSLPPFTDATLKDSGLAALLVDVSAGVVKREAGQMRFLRTFDATLQKTTHIRRQLRASSQAFLANELGVIPDLSHASDETPGTFWQRAPSPS